MASDLAPSAVTVARARTLGDIGERWLESLPQVVADLASKWRLEVEGTLSGASAALVMTAVMSDGRPAVLKIFVPDGATGAGSFAQELRALTAGGGDPYVDVYLSDAEARAVVLERLGRSLQSLELPLEEQLDVIAGTLARSWRKQAPLELADGATKAAWLREFIARMWHELDAPCDRRTVDVALAYASSREEAFDTDAAVLVHGDAHSTNVLEAEPGTFKLIDPEGLRSEPAHDLAIILRELDAQSSPPSCRRLADATGVDEFAIWEWSFVERVSTGLLLMHLGETAAARAYLDAADLLA